MYRLNPLFVAICVATMAAVAASEAAPAPNAQAQIPSPDGVIHACVRLDREGDSGRLARLVTDNEACRRNELRVRWSVAGPKGDTGETGARGVDGADGDDGADGEVGPQGPQGSPGTPAPAGAIAGQLATCVPGATLAGSLVHIPGRAFNVYTGADGTFQIDNVPAGVYDLSVQSGASSIVIPQVAVTDGLVTLAETIQLATCLPDTTAPMAPVSVSTAPASPSSDLNPTLRGLAEPGAMVRVYRSANCQGPLVGIATAVGGSGQFTVSVPVVPLTTNVYTTAAVDAAGNVSACSAPVSYVHVP